MTRQTVNIQGINVLIEVYDDDMPDKEIIKFIEPITFTKYAVMLDKPTSATHAAYNIEHALLMYLPQLDRIRQTIDMNDLYLQSRNQMFSEMSELPINSFNCWNIREPLIDMDYIKNVVVKMNTSEENDLLQIFDNANEPMETFTLW